MTPCLCHGVYIHSYIQTHIMIQKWTTFTHLLMNHLNLCNKIMLISVHIMFQKCWDVNIIIPVNTIHLYNKSE